MAAGVIASSAFVCAMCDEYALRPNTRAELSYADILRKPVLFVNVGTPGYIPSSAVNANDRSNVAETVSRLTLANRVGSGLFADCRDDHVWTSPAGLACLVALLEAEGVRPTGHGSGVSEAALSVCSCSECGRRSGHASVARTLPVTAPPSRVTPNPSEPGAAGLPPASPSTALVLMEPTGTPVAGDMSFSRGSEPISLPNTSGGEPDLAPQPPLGVTLAGLESILEALGGRHGGAATVDLYALERWVHARVTQGAPYVTVLAPEYVRPATAVVVYVTGELFIDVVDAISASGAARVPGAAFYIGALCQPTTNALPEPQLLALPGILRSAGRVVAVVDALNPSGAFTRVWCLLTIVLALQVSAGVHKPSCNGCTCLGVQLALRLRTLRFCCPVDPCAGGYDHGALEGSRTPRSTRTGSCGYNCKA